MLLDKFIQILNLKINVYSIIIFLMLLATTLFVILIIIFIINIWLRKKDNSIIDKNSKTSKEDIKKLEEFENNLKDIYKYYEE